MRHFKFDPMQHRQDVLDELYRLEARRDQTLMLVRDAEQRCNRAAGRAGLLTRLFGSESRRRESAENQLSQGKLRLAALDAKIKSKRQEAGILDDGAALG